MRAALFVVTWAPWRDSPGGRNLASPLDCAVHYKEMIMRTIYHMLHSLRVIFTEINGSSGGFLERVAARSVEEA